MAISLEQIRKQAPDAPEGYVTRKTRHQLPGGDFIYLFVRDGLTGTLVSDQGETLEWMRVKAGAQRLTQRLRLTVEGICRMNDVEADRGSLLVRLPPGGDLKEALDRLGRVCARVAKLTF